MTFSWVLLATLYLACRIHFAVATFCKGHYRTFWIEFFWPVVWIVGALIAPTNRAAARAATSAA